MKRLRRLTPEQINREVAAMPVALRPDDFERAQIKYIQAQINMGLGPNIQSPNWRNDPTY